MRVIGTAQTGEEALEKTTSLLPDVVTLDVEMPRLNGLETLKRIMRDSPRPVIMVSSLTREGADTTSEALDCGAFDYLPKQSSYASLDIVKIREDLVSKIRAAAESRRPRTRRIAPPAVSQLPVHSFQLAPSVVALGTSTGGPKALQEILPMFPVDLPVPVLVLQHMPVGFTGPFAKRLDNLCKVTVREATANELGEPGNVYIAPAGQQMIVNRRSLSKVEIQPSSTPPNTPHIPSVDVMMHSIASVYGGLAMGVIMTGMGADGALGMEAIRKAGGMTVGQDEASCTVYGMPRTCAEIGILRRVVPLQQIPTQVLQAAGYRGKK